MADDKWITVNGTHVLIEEGETPKSAIKKVFNNESKSGSDLAKKMIKEAEPESDESKKEKESEEKYVKTSLGFGKVVGYDKMFRGDYEYETVIVELPDGTTKQVVNNKLFVSDANEEDFSKAKKEYNAHKEENEALKEKVRQEELKEVEERKQRIQTKKNNISIAENDFEKNGFYGTDKNLIDSIYEDDKLYDNYFVPTGGYSGHSKSNRAVDAEENNQFPLSKWGKEKIQQLFNNGDIEFSSSDKFNDAMMNEINKLSDKEIKENLIEESSWHHTSKFYNKTYYYGLKSPLEIYNYIVNKNNESEAKDKKFSNFGKKEDKPDKSESKIKKVDFIRVEYSIGDKQSGRKFNSYQQALDYYTELREKGFNKKTDNLEMHAFGKDKEGKSITENWATE